MTEFMTYRPYSQVELADLGKQVQQTHREHLEAYGFCDFGTRVGLAPERFCRSLLREALEKEMATPLQSSFLENAKDRGAW